MHRNNNTQFQGQAFIPLPSMTNASYFITASKASPTNVPILICGESGVGKDILAHYIHRQSQRLGKFIPINAAGLSHNLAASELFGYRKGAFTGAEQDKNGAFHEANGGTLFLDEIAELPLPTQAELLRTLESGTVRKVGENVEKQVDVRIISATHQDLAQLVVEKKFREDLYHRLCVLPLTIPPLRHRQNDLHTLTQTFLKELSPNYSLSDAATKKICNHAWPGNIRELKNTLTRSALVASSYRLHASDIKIISVIKEEIHYWHRLIHPTIVDTYARTRGSVVETAKKLGVRRSLVYEHICFENKLRF